MDCTFSVLLKSSSLFPRSWRFLVFSSKGCIVLHLNLWSFMNCFPGGSEVKASACNAGDLGSIPGLGKFPWRRKWQPTPVFLPGESHGRRNLVGYSPRGRKRVGHDWATSLSLYELILCKVCGLSFVLFFAYGYSIVSLICFKKTYPSSIEYLLLLCQKSVDCTLWTYLWLLYFVSLIYVFIPP